MSNKSIENWGIYDAGMVSIDMVFGEDERFHPMVMFLLENDEEVSIERGVGIVIHNSFPTAEHAYWDTRINLENLGFLVHYEVFVFDENGEEIEQKSFENSKKETLQ